MEGGKTGVYQYLCDVDPTAVGWLWPGRLARGKLAMLDGDPGLGKSVLTLALAAAVTTGRALPGAAPFGPAGVVLVSAEDDLADTIVPRLLAAGADMGRIVALEAIDDGDGAPPRMVSLPGDLDVLAELIARVEAKLCIFDPFIAFLDGGLDAKVDQDVRRCLGQLRALAQEMDCAMLLVRHLNKQAGGAALYRGGGSIGIVGAARSALLVATHPEVDTLRVLAVSKSNLAAPAPALTFELEPAVDGGVVVVWRGEAAYSADELVSPTAREEAPAVAAAAEFLKDYLAKGSRAAREILAEATRQGIGHRTLKKAKARLRIITKRKGYGENGEWWWGLYDWAWGGDDQGRDMPPDDR